MKIWAGYGSEHSMNLVLIGKFKTERDADRIDALIKKLIKLMAEEENAPTGSKPPEDNRFSESVMEFLRQQELYILSPAEMEQFAFDHHIDLEGDKITVTTDESDISAFVKLFVDVGARVEIYSRHDYPDEAN